jgi:hypothetical protein
MSWLPRLRARADVTIEVPTRTFDVAVPRSLRVLFWTRTWVVQRSFVVGGLPIRELLVTHAKVYGLGQTLPKLSVTEACVVILGTFDALKLTNARAREIWNAWHEVNLLARPDVSRAMPKETGLSPILELVFQLERWPFNFPTERVMRMTMAEAIARLEEFERAQLEREAAAVA